ncbi:MAG: Folate-binding protein YgfZ [Verrucomicrobiales bacterium]|nr:Folate-binding protein YgfZ [Verrucomicrobiales bacterium]
MEEQTLPLILHELHEALGGNFTTLSGAEAVADYSNPVLENSYVRESAAVLDLGFRSRICLAGNDRKRFLHGQVTNNVSDLKTGEGCYAALITGKGRMQSDLTIFALENELLLDFEPGLTAAITQRLDKYIIADDVQIIDVGPHYGLLSIQGPKSDEVVKALDLFPEIPGKDYQLTHVNTPTLGDCYLARVPRLRLAGLDLYIPNASLGAVADKTITAAKEMGGGPIGWTAFNQGRIEDGIPRFGVDMDETNLPPEAGLEKTAISYTKGCYIGQEVIARIRTYGQVAKALRGIKMETGSPVPEKGMKIYNGDKEVGYVTSAAASARLGAVVALGYVRRECNAEGTSLTVRVNELAVPGKIVPIPF